jgi:hypothetical protein
MNNCYDVEILADRYEAEQKVLNELNEYMPGRDRVVAELENGFSVLNICDVWDWFKITLDVDIMELDWNGECNHILKFCENFKLYLYEQPRENFFEWEGIEKAKSMGYKGVVLSNLS